MKKFAVSYINWFDYVLTTKIIEAETWKDALIKSEVLTGYDFSDVEDTLEAYKKLAFDCDSMIEVVEINL